jgi:Xaa-Pro aminopeptidase
MGAEYHGYSADITRTLPVSGTFTVQQRTLYEIVLKAQEAGIRDCIAGNEFKNPHKSAFRIISEALLKLGIASDEDDVRRYFPHGTSHYLGLDVHDPGDYQPLQPGQVITVEPGIYIPAGSPCDPKWWNIGIRIEDDVLITDNLPVVLSGNLPKKTSEIEKIIQDAQQTSRGK